jgi:hypothetical protein
MYRTIFSYARVTSFLKKTNIIKKTAAIKRKIPTGHIQADIHDGDEFILELIFDAFTFLNTLLLFLLELLLDDPFADVLLFVDPVVPIGDRLLNDATLGRVLVTAFAALVTEFATCVRESARVLVDPTAAVETEFAAVIAEFATEVPTFEAFVGRLPNGFAGGLADVFIIILP